MQDVAKRVEQAARLLIELPLLATNRAAGVQMFQFGAPRTVESRLPGRPSRMVGEFALHLQCPWRLLDANESVVGSNEQPDALDAWLRANSCSVEKVSSDDRGGLTLSLTGGVLLTVSPSHDHQDEEQWRLFRPSEDGRHFVVTSSGIEESL